VRVLVRRPAVRLGTGWTELLRVWLADPSLAAINGTVQQRTASDVDDRG